MDFTSAIPNLNADALIIAAVALVVVYGVIAGHGHLVREAISVYVGMVLASAFGGPLYSYLQQSTGDNLFVSQSVVQLSLLVIPIVLLQFGHRAPHHGPRHFSMIITIILAVLTAMLMISAVITQLDKDTLKQLLDDSNLAYQIYNLRLLWIGLVPVAIAASAIFKPKGHH